MKKIIIAILALFFAQCSNNQQQITLSECLTEYLMSDRYSYIKSINRITSKDTIVNIHNVFDKISNTAFKDYFQLTLTSFVSANFLSPSLFLTPHFDLRVFLHTKSPLLYEPLYIYFQYLLDALLAYVQYQWLYLYKDFYFCILKYTRNTFFKITFY